MNILAEIEALAVSAQAITTDAAQAQYLGNKSARQRVKRDIRELSRKYKTLYRELAIEDKNNDREREVSKVPLIAPSDKAQEQAKPSTAKSRKSVGQKGD